MQRRKTGTLQHRLYCDSFAEVIGSRKIKAPLTSEGAIFFKAKVYGLSTGWLTFHHFITFGRKTGPDLSNWEWTGMTKQKQQLVEIWSYLQTSPNHSKPIYWLIGSFHQLDWSLPQPPSMTPLFTIFAGMGPKMVGEYPTISLISPCLLTTFDGRWWETIHQTSLDCNRTSSMPKRPDHHGQILILDLIMGLKAMLLHLRQHAKTVWMGKQIMRTALSSQAACRETKMQSSKGWLKAHFKAKKTLETPAIVKNQQEQTNSNG